jgi:hypothetical protein
MGMRRRRWLFVVLAGLLATLTFASEASAVKRALASIPTHQIAPDIPLDYRGGPVLRTNETFVVFWDPDGGLSQGYRDLVLRYLRDIEAASGTLDVYSVMEEYHDGTGPIVNDSTFAGSAVDSNPYPPGCPPRAGYPVCFTDPALQAELDSFLFTEGIARPANRSFLVLTPPGVNTCVDASAQVCRSGDFCAYHSSFTGAHGDIVYALLPYAASSLCEVGEHPNGSDADPVIDAMSHEHREMINDPRVSSLGPFAAGAQPAWIDEFGFEGSDKCAYAYGPTRQTAFGAYNQVINGHPYLLQMEWSNRLAEAQGFGCVMDSADRAPVPRFDAAINGANVVLDARATTDPDPGDTPAAYLWFYGDGFAEYGTANQSHRYRKAGTYTVTLQVVDGHGATATFDRAVRVKSPSKPTRTFRASFTDTLDSRGSGSGAGTASQLGKTTTTSQMFWDFSDAPASYQIFGAADLANSKGDVIGVNFELTLTDVADPPAGYEFTAQGSYVVLGGFGAFINATGGGTITGHCTSSPDRFDATCTTRWTGTLG